MYFLSSYLNEDVDIVCAKLTKRSHMLRLDFRALDDTFMSFSIGRTLHLIVYVTIIKA